MSATVSLRLRETPQYEDFYGFVQSPFTLAADPRFLYLSSSHEAALQQLLQGITGKKGVVILTGDIGTGKTTICRSVLERLDKTCFTSLLLNPFLSVEELLRETLVGFGVVSKAAVRSGRIASASRHDLVSTLREFLVSLVPIGGSGVLIIDEAQHLSLTVLDELRVLSHLETKHTKLLQIVLVGQRTLLDVLKSPQLRQLDQRISMRTTLSPLKRPDVEAYIGHRLSVAHGSSSIVFETQAIDAISAASQGVPRVINLLCERSLAIGAGFGLRAITMDVVSEAAASLDLRTSRSRVSAWRQRIWRWAGLTAALIALAALLLLAPQLNPF